MTLLFTELEKQPADLSRLLLSLLNTCLSLQTGPTTLASGDVGLADGREGVESVAGG